MKVILYGAAAALNLLHPFVHGLEAGGLDALLVHLDAYLMAVDPYLPTLRRG